MKLTQDAELDPLFHWCLNCKRGEHDKCANLYCACYRMKHTEDYYP